MPVTTVTSTGVVTTSRVIVKSIRWLFGTTAGHRVRITDPKDGSNLWRSVAGGANNVEESITQRHWPNGYNVVTLDSGELDIEIENVHGQALY